MGRDLATPVADIRETIVLLDDKKLPHTVRDAITIMKARAAS
jgi:hypothetical protein